MPTYVAFLRAINLGATRKFPKDAIRVAVEATGARDVETYINTGNVRLTTSLRSRTKVETTLEKVFAADRGFEVPTIAFSPAELCEVVADAAEVAGAVDSVGRHYVSLLKETPPADVRREAEASSTDTEVLVVRGRAAHLVMSERATYHTANLSNAWIERRLGVATNRNLTVLRAIADTWCR